MLAVLLLLGLNVRSRDARAQERDARGREAAAQLDPGPLPAALAVVPGIAVRGLGTLVAGDRRSAKVLALTGAIGFATFFVSGAVLAGTGTARRLAGPVIPFVIAGGGVFFLSWLADIYGASTGGRDVQAAFVPDVEAELGYRYVYDPQFAYRNLLEARGHLRYRRLRATPSLIASVDDDNQRVGLDLAYRIFGRAAGARSGDGSFFDVTGTLLYHRYGSEQFAVWTPAVAFDGRLDLARIGPSLRGAFVEGQLGAGLELYRFGVTGAPPRESSFGMLLARFGFGVYFAGRGARSGEATLYYDHRHDDYAGGLAVQGIGGGILGHLGAAGHAYLSEHWGFGLLCELGAAVVSSATLRYRFARGAR